MPRTKRESHNHITQVHAGGCGACALIRPGMDTRFAFDLVRSVDPTAPERILGPVPQP